MACFVTPETLNYSRSLIKNSQFQFVPSLLKEKKFNDTVEGLTIFVNKKNPDGSFNNIFIQDDGQTLTNVSTGNTNVTIFAKSGFLSKNDKNLVLFSGSIQKTAENKKVSIIKFDKTIISLSGLAAKTITEPKIQETSTLHLIRCLTEKNLTLHNCNLTSEYQKDLRIEMNKRFGIPIYIPLISLLICFLLRTKKDHKLSFYKIYIYFTICFVVLISSEITVRYSGNSFNHSLAYYLFPITFLPITYLLLLRSFKYENLK